jgi:hypothetical protein
VVKFKKSEALFPAWQACHQRSISVSSAVIVIQHQTKAKNTNQTMIKTGSKIGRENLIM